MASTTSIRSSSTNRVGWGIIAAIGATLATRGASA